jgi:hypothetical protein
MSIKEELLEIEHRLGGGGEREYRELLLDDAVVVIPGQSLDKGQTVEAIDREQPWDEFEITDERVVSVGDDGAVLSYHWSSRRGEFSYEALMSSVYVRENGGWKLALHQQTPLGSE